MIPCWSTADSLVLWLSYVFQTSACSIWLWVTLYDEHPTTKLGCSPKHFLDGQYWPITILNQFDTYPGIARTPVFFFFSEHRVGFRAHAARHCPGTIARRTKIGDTTHTLAKDMQGMRQSPYSSKWFKSQTHNAAHLAVRHVVPRSEGPNQNSCCFEVWDLFR